MLSDRWTSWPTDPVHRSDQEVHQKHCSRGVWWAREELNLRPLPCQQYPGNRCARRRSPRSPPTFDPEGKRSLDVQGNSSCRSPATVDAKGKRSLGIQGNALFTPRIDAHELLHRIVQLRLGCPVPESWRRMHTDCSWGRSVVHRSLSRQAGTPAWGASSPTPGGPGRQFRAGAGPRAPPAGSSRRRRGTPLVGGTARRQPDRESRPRSRDSRAARSGRPRSKRPSNPVRMDGSASLTISNRCRPPTRASTSTVSRWTGNPTGPYHRANWSGSVNAW